MKPYHCISSHYYYETILAFSWPTPTCLLRVFIVTLHCTHTHTHTHARVRAFVRAGVRICARAEVKRWGPDRLKARNLGISPLRLSHRSWAGIGEGARPVRRAAAAGRAHEGWHRSRRWKIGSIEPNGMLGRCEVVAMDTPLPGTRLDTVGVWLSMFGHCCYRHRHSPQRQEEVHIDHPRSK